MIGAAIVGLVVNALAAAHRGTHIYVRHGHESEIRILDDGRFALDFAKAMQQQVPPPPAAPTGPAVQDSLKALDDLRAQGLVNDAEYDVKRKQILEDL